MWLKIYKDFIVLPARLYISNLQAILIAKYKANKVSCLSVCIMKFIKVLDHLATLFVYLDLFLAHDNK